MAVADLTTIIQLGEPLTHGGVVVAPLFPRRHPPCDYVTADVAIPLGFRVSEIDAAGSVPELLAVNPLEQDVLLYDGEELLGAKQNRILNVTVLVAAGTETPIPVSCVEEGRWSARSAAFEPAPHAAYPDLRRRKAERLAAEPLEHGAAQGVVWEEVRAKAARSHVHSPTGAQADIYRHHDHDVREFERLFAAVPGQCGALLALGRTMTLDWVSRPDAWQRLHPRLVRGYALDALEHADTEPADESGIAAFVAAVAAAPRSRRPSAGRGHDVRLRTDHLVGSALELDGELIQLSAFTTDTSHSNTRIARPSRRR